MEHEGELQRLRNENTELKKRINDLSSVENAKKKLETKVDHLEQKVR
jgi:homeobox protein cut-like